MKKKYGVTSQVQRISEEDYQTLLEGELQRQGLGGSFVWALFILCVTPNIFNGVHVSSYILLGGQPEDQWCEVNQLQNTNWTLEQRRLVTQGNLTSKGCTVWDLDYQLLSRMTFDDALNHTINYNTPNVISCRSLGYYSYKNPEKTFVAEWDLICEHSLDKTSSQFLLSLGKLVGSLAFGVFADKYGRKAAVICGAYLFIISSFMCSFSPWYNLFILGRFGLGLAAPAFFYPSLSMIVENLCFKHQSWMSVSFIMSYSVGMIVSAVAAELIPPWRHLQISLSVPSLLLILTTYLLNESVRWLITKKRYEEAYKILFKTKSPYEIIPSKDMDIESKEEKVGCWTKLNNGPMKELLALFATPTRSRYILTSNFVFCMASCGYYVTALNASNISMNSNMFVALTGTVDLPSYLIPILMLRCIGQRKTTMVLFLFAGITNLVFLAAPANKFLVVGLAMLGRVGILCSLSVMNLYHAEIYPIEIRNSALGTCSMWSYFGALLAPYIVDCGGLIGWYIPTTLCGCGLFIAGLLHLGLPEIQKSEPSRKEKELDEF